MSSASSNRGSESSLVLPFTFFAYPISVLALNLAVVKLVWGSEFKGLITDSIMSAKTLLDEFPMDEPTKFRHCTEEYVKMYETYKDLRDNFQCPIDPGAQAVKIAKEFGVIKSIKLLKLAMENVIPTVQVVHIGVLFDLLSIYNLSSTSEILELDPPFVCNLKINSNLENTQIQTYDSDSGGSSTMTDLFDALLKKFEYFYTIYPDISGFKESKELKDTYLGNSIILAHRNFIVDGQIIGRWNGESINCEQLPAWLHPFKTDIIHPVQKFNFESMYGNIRMLNELLQLGVDYNFRFNPKSEIESLSQELLECSMDMKDNNGLIGMFTAVINDISFLKEYYRRLHDHISKDGHTDLKGLNSYIWMADGHICVKK